MFYQGDLTELVTDAVVPLAGELTQGGLAAGWFFLRYWEGGPHLRLRVLPRNGRDQAGIRALITERLGRYLLDHPSAEAMGQADYARLAAVLATQERVPGYAERMYPNNSVVFLPYRREHHRYGDGACVEAVEEHFVESSRLAVSLLAGGNWATSRDTVAFCLILLTWLVGRPGNNNSDNNSDSPHHVWTGMLDSAGFGVSEADFEERYLRQRDRLAGLARGLDGLAAGLPDGTGAGPLAQWGRSVLRLRDALAHQAALGRFTPTHPGWAPRKTPLPMVPVPGCCWYWTSVPTWCATGWGYRWSRSSTCGTWPPGRSPR